MDLPVGKLALRCRGQGLEQGYVDSAQRDAALRISERHVAQVENWHPFVCGFGQVNRFGQIEIGAISKR